MEAFVNFLTITIHNYGLIAVFVLMMLESALIPIPSEVTMPFAGFLVGLGILNFWVAIFVGAFGNLVGSLMAFSLGRYMGEEYLKIWIKKWGKWILLNTHDFDKAVLWFKKYGQSITFGSRLLPIVRTFISLPAGIANMNIVKFSVLTFMGSLIWSGILCYVGFKLGSNWNSIEPFFRKFQILIILVFAVMGYAYVKHHLKQIKDEDRK
jgi:membrane protein DedA with SNARE-associated domain